MCTCLRTKTCKMCLPGLSRYLTCHSHSGKDAKQAEGLWSLSIAKVKVRRRLSTGRTDALKPFLIPPHTRGFPTIDCNHSQPNTLGNNAGDATVNSDVPGLLDKLLLMHQQFKHRQPTSLETRQRKAVSFQPPKNPITHPQADEQSPVQFLHTLLPLLQNQQHNYRLVQTAAWKRKVSDMGADFQPPCLCVTKRDPRQQAVKPHNAYPHARPCAWSNPQQNSRAACTPAHSPLLWETH